MRERELLRFLEVADLFFEGRPVFREVFLAPFFAGTFAPFFRASDKPIAIACFRLVTFFPDRPDVNDPFFFLRIALATVLCAFLEYFAIAFYLTSTKSKKSGPQGRIKQQKQIQPPEYWA